MATTFTVEAPVWEGLNYSSFVSVKKAASQTFNAGDLVILSSGLVSNFSGGAGAVNLAIAGEDASQPEAPSGSTFDVVSLQRLHDEMTGIMTLTGTFAQTDIGAEYGLTTSSNEVVVNKSDTTNKRVKVLELVKGAVGDTNVRVRVRFTSDTL